MLARTNHAARTAEMHATIACYRGLFASNQRLIARCSILSLLVLGRAWSDDDVQLFVPLRSNVS